VHLEVPGTGNDKPGHPDDEPGSPSHKSGSTSNHSGVELAIGPGNPREVWVWTGKTVRFGSTTAQTHNPLLLGGPTPAQYPATRGFRRVRLDPSGPISGFAFQVVLFMVAFRYPTVNRKILTIVRRCSFWMYWPPL